jgi:GPH family glycoside/pentoside/hexuronide:cation symporter
MANHEPPTPPAEERVPWNQLIAYGMGGLIPIALFNIVMQLMGLLGNITLGLDALLLGTIMVVPRLWEAFSDPIIGHFSDNTRSRWGRRRPFILVGGLAVAISFIAMWWVPRGAWIRDIFPSDDAFEWFQLAYILLGLVAFFTACAVFEIPHGALGLEMSLDPHERTRLFSVKSFLGNLFALGTPWLIALANLEFFRGAGGNLVDGMCYVSLLISAVLIPMTLWWFASLREPAFAIAKEQKKMSLWHDLNTTVRNKTFLILTATVFTLSLGFNFVNNFANYITIFYLYGGNIAPASLLMGIAGTVWAVTALAAVFPLNWLSRRFGKRTTLLLAIALMCAAQLAKIVCYRPGVLFQFDVSKWIFETWAWLDRWLWLVPEPHSTIVVQAPYLILIPTMLLSAGMLMFFTLGSSMVGDVCDEDELRTGTRSEGMYYSVFWWFIKMGTAFASLVTGALLVFTAFDQQQNVIVDSLQGHIAVVKAEAEKWQTQQVPRHERDASLNERLQEVIGGAEKLQSHLAGRLENTDAQAEHLRRLIERADVLRSQAAAMRTESNNLAGTPAEVIRRSESLRGQTMLLKQQTPRTLFRLRLVEIGVPLALSCASVLLTLCYPLTEARSYEIKEALQRRHAERAS